MVDVSRRMFLGGALALTGAVVLAERASAATPILYGDGVHDDTVALQALLRREPVLIGDECIVNFETATLSRGHFKISRPLLFDHRVQGWTLERLRIDGSEDFQGDFMLIFDYPETARENEFFGGFNG